MPTSTTRLTQMAAGDTTACSTPIATKNDEMVRVYGDITEKIRIIRRLDFIKPKRIQATYDEHAEILNLLLQRQAPSAAAVLRAHIQASKAEVRKITLHMIQTGCAA